MDAEIPAPPERQLARDGKGARQLCGLKVLWFKIRSPPLCLLGPCPYSVLFLPLFVPLRAIVTPMSSAKGGLGLDVEPCTDCMNRDLQHLQPLCWSSLPVGGAGMLKAFPCVRQPKLKCCNSGPAPRLGTASAALFELANAWRLLRETGRWGAFASRAMVEF